MGELGAKVAVGATLAGLLAGAVYLYSVRGQALLLELAAMTRGLLCF
jgi:hypothetical protein